MNSIIDIANWERKVHFEFFNQFDDPSFEITSKVDCTKAFQKAKDLKLSFFLTYLHASMKAVNSIKEFKTRIEDEQVVLYDIIHAGPTIARDNGTFGFSHLPFHEDFKTFHENSKRIIEEVAKSNDLNPSFNKNNVVHYSSIPWVEFTSIKHPILSLKLKDSVPKISFGKLNEQEGRRMMPVSIQANHALMDAYHIGKYLEAFQRNLDA